MRNKIYNYLIFTAVLVFSSSIKVYAQSVGINTKAPAATLDIYSEVDKNLTENIRISNSANLNLLTLLNNGYMGLGTTIPSVRLDLRGNAGSNNIIGIGDTDLTASQAEGGAIKYASTTQELQYSDGIQWMVLEADIPRDCVIATNSYNTVICPDNTATQLGSWDVKYDPTGTFNAETGVFTAPKTGLYTATFSIHFPALPVKAGSYIEGQWIASNGKTIKCTNSFPIAGSFMTAVICSGTLFLNAGDTLYPQVFHNMGQDKYLRVYGFTPSNAISDINFNNMSIVMQ